ALATGPLGNRSRDGCIAQLVEQLTLNQRVVGSNPTAPTIILSTKAAHYRRPAAVVTPTAGAR
ncbi:MAG: hypothetical protein JWP86_3199, partial [Phenylobacterium sp.]|nr:hypothetical protein [Phenylobacterium sp.]